MPCAGHTLKVGTLAAVLDRSGLEVEVGSLRREVLPLEWLAPGLLQVEVASGRPRSDHVWTGPGCPVDHEAPGVIAEAVALIVVEPARSGNRRALGPRRRRLWEVARVDPGSHARSRCCTPLARRGGAMTIGLGAASGPWDRADLTARCRISRSRWRGPMVPRVAPRPDGWEPGGAAPRRQGRAGPRFSGRRRPGAEHRQRPPSRWAIAGGLAVPLPEAVDAHPRPRSGLAHTAAWAKGMSVDPSAGVVLMTGHNPSPGPLDEGTSAARRVLPSPRFTASAAHARARDR